MWQDPIFRDSLVEALSILVLLIVVIRAFARQRKTGTLFKVPPGSWPWGILGIPFFVVLGVLLHNIHPGETIASVGLLILFPVIIYGRLIRDGLLRRNRGLHFIALGLMAYGFLVFLTRDLNLPQPLMNFLYLIGMLLILAMLFVTFQEAKRARA